MRLQIHIDHDDDYIGPGRFLIAIANDLNLGQLRAMIIARLQTIRPELNGRPISLRTTDGYQIDVHDADLVADLIAPDTVIMVRIHGGLVQTESQQLITRLDSSSIVTIDDTSVRALIGIAVLPPTPDLADRALHHLCRSINGDNIDRIGGFVVDEARRRSRLHILLDIHPQQLLSRLLTPALISSAVDAVLAQAGVTAEQAPPAALLVLCHAAQVGAGTTIRETVRNLARCPMMSPAIARLIRDDLVALPSIVTVTPAQPAQWTMAMIESMDEAKFDGVVRRLISDPDSDQFRMFTRKAIETRFESRMASDPGLVSVLYELVLDRRSTWAARLLGLLSRHCRMCNIVLDLSNKHHYNLWIRDEGVNDSDYRPKSISSRPDLAHSSQNGAFSS